MNRTRLGSYPGFSAFQLTSSASWLVTAVWLALPSSALLRAVGAASPASRLEQVVVVFKTHFDIGYTDMASNVVQRYRTKMIDDALQVVDQNRGLPAARQFTWTLPGWPLSQILADWPGQTAERQQRVRAAFQSGRFVTHALPFTTHTEWLEPEDLVRGLGFASRLSRAAGLDLPRDAKMTDVPCHSWLLPTLLRHAGVDFLHLGCNAASSSPKVPVLFWWEGPDGSRLLTMYSAESYGTGLIPPKDWPHKTWLALIHTGDNHGPPTPEEVRQLLQQAERELPGVRVRIGRLSDFADAILAERSAVPVVRGDMPDTWIHGPMCDPAGARLARNYRPLLAATEALDTHLRAWGLRPPELARTIATAYEQSLLYGEHTWGGALYWVTQYAAAQRLPYGQAWRDARAQGKYQRLEGSWAEHTAYIEKVRDLVAPALEGELRTLAAAVKTPGPRVVVFNPLPWSRDGLANFAAGGGGIEGLRPAEGGEPMPVERVAEGTRFVACQVPAMGYRVYVPAPAGRPRAGLKADESSGGLESPHFRAVLDPARGVVRSLKDQRTGRELVNGAASQAFGQFLHERFSADEVYRYVKAYVKIAADWATNELGKPNLPPSAEAPYRAWSPGPFRTRMVQTPCSVRAVMEAMPGRELAYRVTCTLTLYADLPYADWELTLHDKPADPWPEAGWLCLPFRCAAPRFHLGRLGALVDPANDLVPGTNFDLLALDTGLALAEASGRGVGLCALDNALISLGRPGCWRYSAQPTAPESSVYVNLFNNQWTTNFRLWNQGTWTARVRLWAFGKYQAARAITVPSAEARSPLLTAWVDAPAGTLPLTGRGLEVSPAGALVTAFGPNPDGPGTLVRLWEYSGRDGSCTVRLPEGLKARRVQPVDLRGRPKGAPMPVYKQSFKARLHAFAPASFLIAED